MDYRLRSIREKYDLSDNEQKYACLRESYEIIAKIPDPAKREIYGESLAESLQVKKETVEQEIESFRHKLITGAKTAVQKKESQVERNFQPVSRDLKYEDAESAAAEEELVALLYLYPELIKTPNLPNASDFSSSVLGCIYKKICDHINNGSTINMNTLADRFSKEEIELLTKSIQGSELSRYNRHRNREGIFDCINKINRRKRLRERKNDKEGIAMEVWRMRQNQ